MNDEYIYLDYAANTPVDKEVLDVFNDTTLKYYANLNSTHKLGRIVKKEDVVLEPLINGGSSTTIYRSGTPIVGQVAALNKDLELAFTNFSKRYEYVKINRKLRENLLKYQDVKINTLSEENPYILNLSVIGVKAVEFKEKLEEYGVCISIKSVCIKNYSIKNCDGYDT